MNELQSVTDIDEVIKYAERRVEGCHQMASSYHTDEGVYLQEETRFQYRAILWENIHEWLEEVKELRKKQRPHGEWAEYTVSTFRGTDGCGEPQWGKGKKFICKQCLRRTVIRENFCPNCGADMRRKEGEAK